MVTHASCKECLSERLNANLEGSTRLAYTGLHGGLEHLKIEKRLFTIRVKARAKENTYRWVSERGRKRRERQGLRRLEVTTGMCYGGQSRWGPNLGDGAVSGWFRYPRPGSCHRVAGSLTYS